MQADESEKRLVRIVRTEAVYACFPFLMALAVWAWLSGHWYGGWMQSIFGEVPIANPGYAVAAEIFTRAPYIAAGVICGMGIGMGATSLGRLLPRFIAPITFIGLLLAIKRNHAPHMIPDFTLPLLASCAIWVGWSLVYVSLKRRE